ncbi:MAG: single-stranded DNA-binding protein [Chloroflexota bacterium]|nr:single-stranded DNA-binding protein [Chloroflexota bacterium]
MAWLNKIMVIGNVGTDPEMRFTPNGKPVTSFRLATNRFFSTSDGERKRETEWFDIVTWDRQAESCNQFLTKGQRVYVEGRLRTRSWDSPDGQKRFRVEIHANRVIFLDRRPGGGFPEGEGHEFEEIEGAVPIEELPF